VAPPYLLAQTMDLCLSQRARVQQLAVHCAVGYPRHGLVLMA